jgi:hypothetical protein
MKSPSVLALLPIVSLVGVGCASAPTADRVFQLFQVLETGNFTDFYALFSPQSTWTTIGFGVRTKPEMIVVFESINYVLANPPLVIKTDLVISQGEAGAYTSTQAHVPNGIIGKDGMKDFSFFLQI